MQLLLDGADAGADDFLLEKWHKNDLNVRMRIAVRTIDLQRALQTHIKELETVLRRHDLLREVVSKMSPKETEPKLQAFANPKNPVLADVIEPSRIARRAMAARGE